MNQPTRYQIATCSQEYGKWAKQVRSRWESRKERRAKADAKRAAEAQAHAMQYETEQHPLVQSIWNAAYPNDNQLTAAPAFESDPRVSLRDGGHSLTMADFGLAEQAVTFKHVLQALGKAGVPLLDQAQALALAQIPAFIDPTTISQYDEAKLMPPVTINETPVKSFNRLRAPKTDQESHRKWTSSLRRDESNPEYWFRRQIEYLQHMEDRYQEDFTADWFRLGLQPDEGRTVVPATARLPRIQG